VAYISNASLPIQESPEGYLETMPDIVVEVLSRNDTKSYIDRKIADYLTAGVKQVWIADPKTKTVTIHSEHHAPQQYADSETLQLDEIIPGFELPIADVFAD